MGGTVWLRIFDVFVFANSVSNFVFVVAKPLVKVEFIVPKLTFVVDINVFVFAYPIG